MDCVHYAYIIIFTRTNSTAAISLLTLPVKIGIFSFEFNVTRHLNRNQETIENLVATLFFTDAGKHYDESFEGNYILV